MVPLADIDLVLNKLNTALAVSVIVTVIVSALPESSDTNIDLITAVVADGTVYKVVADVLVRSILVSEDSGNADTITVTITDTASAVFNLFKTKSISANGTTELLTGPLVVEESEVVKVTAATANRLHVVLSALEIKPREVTS